MRMRFYIGTGIPRKPSRNWTKIKSIGMGIGRNDVWNGNNPIDKSIPAGNCSL